MTVIASRSGIESLLSTHPDVRVHVAAIDDELTEVRALPSGLRSQPRGCPSICAGARAQP